MQESVEFKEQQASNEALNRPRADNRYSMEVINKRKYLNEPDSTFVNSVETSQQH